MSTETAYTVTVTDQRNTSATKAFRVEIQDKSFSGLGYGDTPERAFFDALRGYSENVDSAKRAAYKGFKGAFEQQIKVAAPEPLRTTYVESGATARQEIDAFAGEPINFHTPRTGRFFNDPINPYYKNGFLLSSGEVLVIQHHRLSGDMNLSIFANNADQRAYEEHHDRAMVADPETGRRSFLEQGR